MTRDELVERVSELLFDGIWARYQNTKRQYGDVVAMDMLRSTLSELEAMNAAAES